MKRAIRELRIIGGSLRGRKLRFPEDPQIRPTPDRVRETLFNWLQPRIDGARCLDLFAGSGALGLEALSRGASSVLFVDESRAAIDELRTTAERFGVAGAQYMVSEAIGTLRGLRGPFDIVFIDPPFATGLLASALTTLAATRCMALESVCYVETSARQPLPTLAAGWEVHREGKAGEVGYYLLKTPAPSLP